MSASASEQAMTIGVPEVARRLGVSRGCIYRAIDAGRLPAIRVGRRRLLLRRAIEALLQDQHAPTPETAR